jgi:hypothetical protein
MRHHANMEPHVRGREEQRFGAGLTEADVRRFQDIVRRSCGTELGLEEAWSRAIAILTLVCDLLHDEPTDAGRPRGQAGFALPPT